MSKKQELVISYLSNHPGVSKEELCQEIYGDVGIFAKQDLDSILNRLRKKGHLFYSVGNGEELVDMSDESVEVSKKMKVQRRIGNGMLGSLKASVNIIKATNNPLQIEAAKEQVHQVENLLLETRNYFYENSRGANLEVKSGQESTEKVLVSRKS